MKKVILLFYFMPCLAYGQIVENFEQGNLYRWTQSTPGHWKADTSESISGRYSLHHIFDNTDAGSDQIGFPIDSLHPSEGKVTWQFMIRHGYDPSSSNNWSLFLMSDSDPSIFYTEGSTDGFALGVNITGYDDTLRLWKVKGNAVTAVVNSGINWQTIIGTESGAQISVERSTIGKWVVSVSLPNGQLISSESGTDSELFACKWLVLNYNYTSSKDKLLWFDDLSVDGIFHEDDELPPSTPETPAPGDIVITEIMADPEPVVSLPAKEYIEITNRTGFTFNLKNWKIASGDQTYLIPESILGPTDIMIICSVQDTSVFSGYGKVTGMKQFPALTDNGKMLLLYDSSGRLIHGVEYSSGWYQDELKSKGGWSLEMIDRQYPFYYNENWIASISLSGGTPGSVNSVAGSNPDIFFSGALNVFPDDSLTITVTSPEPLFSFLSMIDSINIDGHSPVEIILSDPLFRQFIVRLDYPLFAGKIYQFKAAGDIKDFAGNRLQKDSYEFGLTGKAEPGDILFNELLFNPLPGDPDYIELYNASRKTIDVSRLELVSVNDNTGDTSQIYFVSDEHRCFFPGEYYAISTDVKKITDRYFSSDRESLFEISSLPSMPDDNGHLILFSRELEKIDEVSYRDKMQSSLLSGHEGIALEKITPTSNSGMASNWHSASESSGWGTPGAKNSVCTDIPVTSDMVSLSSTKISPDDDGFEDILLINFSLTGNSNIISVTIFDESGNYIRKIAENLYAGTAASLNWDGTADDGSMVRTGIYIVFIKMFDEAGKIHHWKKVCTVIRR